ERQAAAEHPFGRAGGQGRRRFEADLHDRAPRQRARSGRDRLGRRGGRSQRHAAVPPPDPPDLRPRALPGPLSGDRDVGRRCDTPPPRLTSRECRPPASSRETREPADPIPVKLTATTWFGSEKGARMKGVILNEFSDFAETTFAA